MKFSPNNDWQDRTSAGHLRALMRIYETTHSSNEYPNTKEACMQMLFDRVHLYAECGYSSYIHAWESKDVPKDYTLEEILELAEDAFVECDVSLVPKYISICGSSSSSRPILETSYELTIDWCKDQEIETPQELEKKWNDSKGRRREDRKKHGFFGV